jgi:hypothetical protein
MYEVSTVTSPLRPHFLDLSQPRVSGLDVLNVVKSTSELMHIPIVVARGEFVRFIESCYEFWSRVLTLCPQPPQKVRKPFHLLAR